MTDAAALRGKAVDAARAGQIDEAKALFGRAVAAAGDDPAILNSAAVFLSKHGAVDEAIALLRRAVTDRAAHEPLFNLALILTSAGRAQEALGLLGAREASLGGIARYWSIRAGAERALGRKRDALASFEQAARRDPSNAKALHGRARMALETGRPAADHYHAAITAQPADAEAWLGLAQALDAEGRGDEATQLAGQIVAQSPGWVAALELLAQLRWSRGEQDSFAEHYAAAVRTNPDSSIYASWCRILVGADQFEAAADVAASARRALADDSAFALLEAEFRGAAGDDAAAGAIFDRLSLDAPDRYLHEARHRLRLGDAARAEQCCGDVIAAQPDHVAAWALRGIAWRLLDDPRGEWLHGQEGLVSSIALNMSDEDLSAALAFLDQLHDRSAVPVGQSVRQGTQTRGGLFDRHEPIVRRIEQAFVDALDAYRDTLPPRDDSHPLLRHRDAPWRIAGSWSVRLFEAGHHVQHIHPNGLISSAAWFVVPPSAGDASGRSGWLELGRPPADLRLDLPPLAMIEPGVGRCALFPSTLYHGTRRFPAGKRLSVAIDINRADGP